ncbi:MAG: TonB-dependent receptor [Burkholderiales bacterium]|nr:TonB-dependent receptor [Burkholderiales bacterium]
MTDFVRRALPAALTAALAITGSVQAQDSVPAPTPVPSDTPSTVGAPGRVAAPERSPRAAAKPVEPVERVDKVEITGKNTGTEERRQSTAAKIVITREDIEQYGDSNLGEVMRRLPGVTQGGRPGRGGPIAMRGMGGGFTQILLDGQRIPPGFSIEDITPEQVERIEIFRAPTAETGARAIAGTINIILREPLRQTNNDVRIGDQRDRGLDSPQASWSRNGTVGDAGTYNATVSAGRTHLLTDTAATTRYFDDVTNGLLIELDTFGRSESDRKNVHLNGRLQWRLGNGEQFGIQSFGVHTQFNTVSDGTMEQPVGTLPAPYATRHSATDGRFDTLRLGANLNKRFNSSTRYELRVGGGGYESKSNTVTALYDKAGSRSLLQSVDGKTHDRSWLANAKVVHNVPDSSHAITAGLETENVRWTEDSVNILNGVQQLADLGTQFGVTTRRNAFYLQDEFDIAQNWAANLGLRYETIRTQSSNADDVFVNTSKVLTPLGHIVWRFAAPSRDQIRLSLTQSYRAPTPQQLGTRPSLNVTYPVPGANTVLTSDSAGNPNLKPERANGIDLAFERYFKSGGVASVNLFQRSIRDLIRSVVALENASWASSPRYVRRPQNLGNAMTRGIEFDLKFQLRELMNTQVPLSVRANLNLYDSKVDAVPGPNNRIDSQPRATGNFGLEYRPRGIPVSFGGNLAWTPAYAIQQTETTALQTSLKRVIDAYALWTLNPTAKLRLSFSNISPLHSFNTTTVVEGGQRQIVLSDGRTDMSVAIRLEMRL